MDSPVDTWNYFIAGYTVIFCTIGFYALSLAFRWKKFKDAEKRWRSSDQ